MDASVGPLRSGWKKANEHAFISDRLLGWQWANPGFTEEGNTCKEAVKLLEAGDLQGAYDLFLSIKDSPEAAEYSDLHARI